MAMDAKVAADKGMYLVGPSPFFLVQRPLQTLGNTVVKLDPVGAERFSRELPPPGGIQEMLTSDQSRRFIHPEEFQLAAELLKEKDKAGAWEVMKNVPSSNVCVKRRAGEPLNGPITVMIETTLTGIPLEVGAEVLNNFSARSSWDSQQIDFFCHDDWGCPETHANGIFRFVLHLPPIPDREFCNLFALAKAADGSGYMTFCRECRHPHYEGGRGSLVRASLMGNVMYMARKEADPSSSTMVVITKQDAKLGVIPHWLINYFLPGELVKWKKRCQSQCQLRLDYYRKAAQCRAADGALAQVPMADFFRPMTAKDITPVSAPPSNEVVAGEVLPPTSATELTGVVSAPESFASPTDKAVIADGSERHSGKGCDVGENGEASSPTPKGNATGVDLSSSTPPLPPSMPPPMASLQSRMSADSGGAKVSCNFCKSDQSRTDGGRASMSFFRLFSCLGSTLVEDEIVEEPPAPNI